MLVFRPFLFIVHTFVFINLIAPSLAIAQNQCQSPAEVEIFLMLDFTGSSKAIYVDAEKTAVRQLLDYYESVDKKPRIALGRFNTEASVEVKLTADYDLIRQGLDALPDAGTGGTRIDVGLKTAREYMTAESTAMKPKYIVLFSDGLTSAATEAKKQANMIKDEGSYIFAIHYPAKKDESKMAPGEELMRFLASSPNVDFYRSVEDDLPSALKTISHNIVCEDGNPCTSNVCELSSGTCKMTEPDSDGDGVKDCNDICPNQDDSLVDRATLKDKDGDGVIDCQDSCPSDFKKVVPGLCGCGAPDEDLNHDGYIDCLSCAPLNNGQTKASLKKALASQKKLVSKFAARLYRSHIKKAEKTAKKSLKAAKVLAKEGIKLISALPDAEMTCKSRYCSVAQNNRASLDRMRQISTLLQQHCLFMSSSATKLGIKLNKKLLLEAYRGSSITSTLIRQIPQGPAQCLSR